MSEVISIVAGIGAVLGLAAVILWSIEALARRIGGKRTTILLLGVIPSLIGAGVAYLDRVNLQWWELLLYPLAGPVVACGVLVLGYVAVSPFGIPDILGLVCSMISRGAKALRRLAGNRRAS
jgi:hypothetical protein